MNAKQEITEIINEQEEVDDKDQQKENNALFDYVNIVGISHSSKVYVIASRKFDMMCVETEMKVYIKTTNIRYRGHLTLCFYSVYKRSTL